MSPEQASRHPELSADLFAEIFPNSKPGTTSYDHNRRDCRHLSAHHLSGREVFVTLDRKLARKAPKLAGRGIRVALPVDVELPVVRARRPGRDSAPVADVIIRSFEPGPDEGPLRALMADMRTSYPDFDGWLTKTFRDADARIQVAVLRGELVGVAITKSKDSRVAKLSAFMVSEAARGSGLGSHLLWSELQHWYEQAEVCKLYVTIADSKARLLAFFRDYGFLVEGVSARRYGPQSSEIVLAKHFERSVVQTTADFDSFNAGVARPVLAPSWPEQNHDGWFTETPAAGAALDWEPVGTSILLARTGNGRRRAWSVEELESMFAPVRFVADDRRALLVPIHPLWASALMTYIGRQPELPLGDEGERRLLRSDNVYYCFPKAQSSLRAGTPILFYVTSPLSSVIGAASLLEFAVGDPDDLHKRFGGLGVYDADQVAGHARQTSDGPRALALRFGRYRAFHRPVDVQDLLAEAGWKQLPQGLTPIQNSVFEAVWKRGGLTW